MAGVKWALSNSSHTALEPRTPRSMASHAVISFVRWIPARDTRSPRQVGEDRPAVIRLTAPGSGTPMLVLPVDIHAVGSFSGFLSFPTSTLEWAAQLAEIQAARPMLRGTQSGSNKKGSMGKVTERESDLRDPRCPESLAHSDMGISQSHSPPNQLPSSKIPLVTGPSPFKKKSAPGPPVSSGLISVHCASAQVRQHGLICDPCPSPPGGRACQGCAVTSAKAISAPVASPPFRDRQCPFPILCAFGYALSRNRWTAAGCCSKYASQWRPNIDGSHPAARCPSVLPHPPSVRFLPNKWKPLTHLPEACPRVCDPGRQVPTYGER
jgi:hypothetical protein